MENSEDKEWNSTEKLSERNGTFQGTTMLMECQTTDEPSTSDSQETAPKRTKRKRNGKYSDAFFSQDDDTEKKKKISIPPLPSKMPPVYLLHRDIVRAWSRELNLSTKGQKLEVYKRICDHAYPNQTDFPNNAKEARILTQSQREARLDLGEITPESLVGMNPLRVTPPIKEEVSPLEGPTTLLEGVDTSSPSCASTGAMSGKAEKVQKPSAQKSGGDKWCVVHGRSFSTNRKGWVRLQFHAGQVWVPEEEGRVCALFLLPACTFPPPDLEDNMLCPKCIQKNKVLMKSLQ
ncbi:developmental pluripotency-associated protein 4 [Erinaceus europaeus]|uniref:Developmental pluripotency-associated protein 4 n=1 Tax=Erinaceus europaeus TaxID=9365 RepID=A0A1S3AQG6_ERIEU|nr:developmental pluripotency-associated protein 4 [Erinaceus europaeus]